MENLNKLVQDNIKTQLKLKGFAENDLNDKLNEILKESIALGHTDEEKQHKPFIRNRINSYAINFINSKYILIKSVIVGLGQIKDVNEKATKDTERNIGNEWAVFAGIKHEVPVNENGKYVVKAGHYHAGFKQSLPIPTGKSWEQQGFMGIEVEEKMYYKPCKLQGDWLKTELHTAGNGDVIQISVDPSKIINAKCIYINKYDKKATLDEKDYLKIINESLVEYSTTIEKLSKEENLSNRFCIIKGDVGVFDNNSFTFTDPNLNLGEYDLTKTIETYSTDIQFVEGAMGVTFIGEVYKKSSGIFGMSFYGAIVPDLYKRKELSKENVEEIVNNVDDNLIENIETIDFDEDL